jgi:hypothetical protein
MSDEAPKPDPQPEAEAPPPVHSPRPWHGDDPPPAAPISPAERRRTAIFFLAGAFLAIGTVILIFMLLIKRPPPEPYFLTINISAYNASQYVPPPFGAQDSAVLMRHFTHKAQATSKDKKRLRTYLEELARPSTRPVIVHISALALVRDETVYLLPGDADPDDKDTWLDVLDVVKALRDCPTAEKLLILDLAHPTVDARLGVLVDRVAKHLDEVLRKQEPNYHVLVSCSSGEYSLHGEALQCSVFAHYLDLGLQGYAEQKKDGSITVRELADFVAPRVDRWAQINRGVRQQPRLYGKGSDFAVAPVTDERSARTMPKLDAFPETLKKAWQDRDDARTAGAHRRAPRHLGKLDASLLRQDNLWQAGRTLGKSLAKETQDLADDLVAATILRPAPIFSLAPSASKKHATLPDTLVRIVMRENDPKKPDPKWNEALQAEVIKKLQEDKKAEFEVQAWAVLDSVDRIKDLSPDHVRIAHGVASELKPKPSVAELVYLRRLSEFAKDYYEPWPGEKVRSALQTVHAQYAALAALDREPQALAWVSAQFEEADKLRLGADQKLLRAKPSTWTEAQANLLAARKLYEDAARNIELVRRARSELDRAFADLPGYMALICDWPEADPQAERAWLDAIDEALLLQAFFAARPKIGQPGANVRIEEAQLEIHAGKLGQLLASLQEMLDVRLIALGKDEDASVQMRLRILLNSPLLKSAQRADLASRQRQLAAKLHAQADKLDQADLESVLAPHRGDAVAQVRTCPALRLRISLALLRLAGVDAQDRKLDLPADNATLTSREWTAFETTLQQGWGAALAGRWRNAQADAAGDAVNRLVSPWESDDRPNPAQRDVSFVLQKDLRKQYLQWLAGRLQAEGQFLSALPDREAADFFTQTGQRLKQFQSEIE